MHASDCSHPHAGRTGGWHRGWVPSCPSPSYLCAGRVHEWLRRVGSGCELHAQAVSGAVPAVHAHAERCRERPVPVYGCQARWSGGDLRMLGCLREFSSSSCTSFLSGLSTISQVFMIIVKYPVSQIIFPMCISRAISLGSCAAL